MPSWDSSIHAVVVRGNPPDRGKRGLTPHPETGSALLRSFDIRLVSPLMLQNAERFFNQTVDLSHGSIKLDKQHRFSVQWIARVNKCLSGLYREPVHHLKARRNNTIRKDSAYCISGNADVSEGRQNHRYRFRLWRQQHFDLSDHTEHPL